MSDTIRRVVVGVDGSPGSIEALRHAAGEARRHRAELHPVYVYSSPEGDYVDRVWPLDPRTETELREKAREKLLRSCEHALGGLPDDVPFTPAVRHGEPRHLLVRCTRPDGDLLVVGTRCHGPVRRLLIGSVSRYCLRRARCPVLAVPGGPQARPRPARGRGVRHG
ncbi:universal stress protein [Streptomyces sp. URMC 123]|uniref:universal stress protein n=1 Tax=Streptomyces sp. URMC 123 TaxID=3423403 RepID=UPI003F1BD7F7